MFIRLLILLACLSLMACQPQPETSASNSLTLASGTPVKPNTQLTFPKDHGIHPEQGIEWWYITANLETNSGETFGVQWTLFRTLFPGQLTSTWWDNQFYFAHFAMQHKQHHVAFERFARAGQAKVTSSPFSASLDDWSLKSTKQEFLPLQLNASEQGYEVNFTLNKSPMTLHGDKGYSQKTDSGHASYYYSYPFLQVDGDIRFNDKTYKVTGNAWYDREWSASLLDKSQLGWDWFSLVNDSTEKNEHKGLMLFCIRGSSQSYEYCAGSKIFANGEKQALTKDDIQLSTIGFEHLDEKPYPSKWRLSVEGGDDIVITTVTKDSRNDLLIPYWEGRIKSTGGFNGKGYAELTGY